jgi:hypothetical protein
VPNSTLYNGLEFVSIRLLEQQLCFAGHCIRSKWPISELLFWDHTKLVNCKCAKGASNAHYSRQLFRAIGGVDGLVTSDEAVMDREAWQSRIKMIVRRIKKWTRVKEKRAKIGALKIEVRLLLYSMNWARRYPLETCCCCFWLIYCRQGQWCSLSGASERRKKE